MAGLLASGIIKWTTNKLSSLVSPQIVSSSSDEQSASFRDLRDLQRTMARIQRTLDAMDEHNIRDEAERLRLWELQQFAYDAQDAVDEYRYELLRRRMEDQSNQRQSSRSRKRKRKGDKKVILSPYPSYNQCYIWFIRKNSLCFFFDEIKLPNCRGLLSKFLV